MKKIIFLLLFAFIASCAPAGATYYNSVFDLKKVGVVGQNHNVGSFKGGTLFGGGQYIWVRLSTVGLKEMLGYTVFPNGNTTGYWQLDLATTMTPEIFGADHSGRYLTNDGITAPQAALYWPALPFNINTTTWDEVGLAVACYYMKELGNGSSIYRPTNFELTGNGFYCDYFVKGTVKIQLPYITVSNGRRMTYSFRNITVHTLGTPTTWILGDTLQSSYSFNEIVLNSRIFLFDNVNVYNDMGGSHGGTAFMIDGSYGSHFTNCHSTKMDSGMVLRFCQGVIVTHCDMQFPKNVGFYIGVSATTVPYPSGYGCCNSFKSFDNRVQMNGDDNTIAFYYEGSDCGSHKGGIIEGQGGTNTIGVYFNAMTWGASNVKSFEMDNVHVEVGPNGSGKNLAHVFKFIANACAFEIKNIYVQGDIDSGFVTAGKCNGTSNSVYLSFMTNDAPTSPYYWQFCNQNGTQTNWIFGKSALPKYPDVWANTKYWKSGNWNTIPTGAPLQNINNNASFPYPSVVLTNSYRIWEFKLY